MLLVGVVAACKGAPPKVELVLNQPEASAASLIKTYQADDVDAQEKVVDDFYFTLEERALTCSSQVYEEILACQEKARHMYGSEIERVLAAGDCVKAGPACGCKIPATARSKPYKNTLGNVVVSGGALSIEACRIKAVDRVPRKTKYLPEKKKEIGLDGYGDALDFYGCDDLKETDQFAVVGVECNGFTGPLQMFFVDRAGAWKLFAFGGDGYRDLMVRAGQKAMDAKEKKRLDELNKYMKK